MNKKIEQLSNSHLRTYIEIKEIRRVQASDDQMPGFSRLRLRIATQSGNVTSLLGTRPIK